MKKIFLLFILVNSYATAQVDKKTTQETNRLSSDISATGNKEYFRLVQDSANTGIYRNYKIQWLELVSWLKTSLQDVTHRFVTDTDKANWNLDIDSTRISTVGKTGVYNDLTGKPTIPTVTPSALTRTNGNNIEITLGGTPSTALLQPTSITARVAGPLADSLISSASTWNAKQNSLGFTAVPNTRTVNGHALSGNIDISALDVGLGSVDNISDNTRFGFNGGGRYISVTQAKSFDATNSWQPGYYTIVGVFPSHASIIDHFTSLTYFDPTTNHITLSKIGRGIVNNSSYNYGYAFCEIYYDYQNDSVHYIHDLINDIKVTEPINSDFSGLDYSLIPFGSPDWHNVELIRPVLNNYFAFGGIDEIIQNVKGSVDDSITFTDQTQRISGLSPGRHRTISFNVAGGTGMFLEDATIATGRAIEILQSSSGDELTKIHSSFSIILDASGGPALTLPKGYGQIIVDAATILGISTINDPASDFDLVIIVTATTNDVLIDGVTGNIRLDGGTANTTITAGGKDFIALKWVSSTSQWIQVYSANEFTN